MHAYFVSMQVCIGNNATSFEIYAVNDEQQLQLQQDYIDLKYVDEQLMVVITVTFSDQYLNHFYSLLVVAGNSEGSSNSTDMTLLSMLKWICYNYLYVTECIT